MPKGPTLFLVIALAVIALVSGLVIASGAGADARPPVAFTSVAASATVVATATEPVATATEPVATEPAATATTAASPTRAATTTPAPSATRPATATPAASPTTASSPTATAEASGGEFIEYTVQPGDTLNGIARRYNTTPEAILAVNEIANPESLTVGAVLRIPVSVSDAFIEYTVQPGDTLNGIARRYGVTADDILQINVIPNPRSLTVGTVLRIPRR
jgi:LysM repeat protein